MRKLREGLYIIVIAVVLAIAAKYSGITMNDVRPWLDLFSTEETTQ